MQFPPLRKGGRGGSRGMVLTLSGQFDCRLIRFCGFEFNTRILSRPSIPPEHRYFLNTCPAQKIALATTRHAGMAINGKPKNNCQPMIIGNSINTRSCNNQPIFCRTQVTLPKIVPLIVPLSVALLPSRAHFRLGYQDPEPRIFRSLDKTERRLNRGKQREQSFRCQSLLSPLSPVQTFVQSCRVAVKFSNESLQVRNPKSQINVARHGIRLRLAAKRISCLQQTSPRVLRSCRRRSSSRRTLSL